MVKSFSISMIGKGSGRRTPRTPPAPTTRHEEARGGELVLGAGLELARMRRMSRSGSLAFRRCIGDL